MYKRNDLITFDVEVFSNYFLVALKQLNTGKVIHIEARGADSSLTKRQRKQLVSLLAKYVSFGFNSNNYDIPMVLLALRGTCCNDLKKASDRIIMKSMPSWMTFRYYDLQPPVQWRTFDIMPVAPSIMTSLKIYGGRLHSKTIQDLPYPHDSILTDDQMIRVSVYCINDLNTNIDLYTKIKPRIDLRADMSDEYNIDMMSKSDAQMAEAIFKHELAKHGINARKPADKSAGFTMRYQTPAYIKFQSMELKLMVADIEAEKFKLSGASKITLPEWLRTTPIHIGKATYKIGIGGLHSQEKHTHHIPPKGFILADRDVASYYPRIILSLGLYPQHLTDKFLTVYNALVDRRLTAKARAQEITAEIAKLEMKLDELS